MTKKSIFFSYYLYITVLPFLSACSIGWGAGSDDISVRLVEKNKSETEKRNKVSPLSFIQSIQTPGRLRIILYSDLCFQSNGKLTQGCSRQLNRTMKTIKQYSEGIVQIVGYTDDIYDSKFSKKLSQCQANKVLSFLWSKGIESNRLRAIGFANHDSIASNHNVKANAKNRRIEITIVK